MMKLSVLLSSLVLFTCLIAFGQQGPGQTPQVGTPPTFPQSQTPDSSKPDTMPPDTKAPQSTPQAAPEDSGMAGGENQLSTIQGCLKQSGDTYTLTDQSGATYQLQGDSSRLSRHVGQEVTLMGTLFRASARGSGSSTQTATGTMGGDPGSGSATAENSFSVASINKVADSCSSSASK